MPEPVIFLLLACFAALSLGLVSGTYTQNLSIGNVTANTTLAVAGENSVQANPTVLAAQAGTLTVRTDDTSGSLTMVSGSHGITTGQRVDLYWTGGKCYGAVVGTVAGSVVPIASVAGGDILPLATTVVNVGIPNEVAFNVIGNNMQGLVIYSPVEGYVILADGSTNHHVQYLAAGGGYAWATGSGVTNPIAGDTLTKVWMSHSSTGAESTGMACAAITN
jgi:hypothetical protein